MPALVVKNAVPQCPKRPTALRTNSRRRTDVPYRGAYTRSGMLTRGGPFRLLLTLLLAVVVPFCCCNFHSLLSACGPCGPVPQGSTAKTCASVVTCDSGKTCDAHHADCAAHDHDSDLHADQATSISQSEPSPCGPGHDDHDCKCGKQHTLTTVSKPTVELLLPILLVILPLPIEFDAGAPSLMWAGAGHLPIFSRPAATLLSLHCALIV